MNDLIQEKATKKDINIIKKQLNRYPENIMGIAKRCSWNNPVVIVTHPFDEDKGVFPTTLWLSCPFLVKEISRLEDRGLIQELTAKIKQDQNFKKRLKKAHKVYAEKRFNLLEEKMIKKIKKISPDILKVIKSSGVAGIRDKEGIKCLHGHLADYLVNKINPVGKIVKDKLPSLSSCDIKCDFDLEEGSKGKNEIGRY